MVYIDDIWGTHHYKTYVEARKSAHNELTGPYRDAYGQIQIFPNQHSNKPKEVLTWSDAIRGVITMRVEDKGIVTYAVQKNGELGRRL